MITLLAVFGAVIELLEIPAIVCLIIFAFRASQRREALEKKVTSLEWQLAELLPDFSSIQLPPEEKLKRIFQYREQNREDTLS